MRLQPDDIVAAAAAGKHVFLDEASVMGTENALLAAALTQGPTTIANMRPVPESPIRQ